MNNLPGFVLSVTQVNDYMIYFDLNIKATQHFVISGLLVSQPREGNDSSGPSETK